MTHDDADDESAKALPGVESVAINWREKQTHPPLILGLLCFFSFGADITTYVRMSTLWKIERRESRGCGSDSRKHNKAGIVVCCSHITVTHRQDRVRGHRTGSNNSEVEAYRRMFRRVTECSTPVNNHRKAGPGWIYYYYFLCHLTM